MDTTTLEAKLLQQLIAMKEAVLHEVFLDLQKVHSALDRDKCLNILAGYGVGSRTLRILRTYWGRIQVVARDGEYMVLL